VFAAAAITLSVDITDSCNAPVTSGSVVGKFFSDGRQMSLAYTSGSTWSVSWTPLSAAENEAITVLVIAPDGSYGGNQIIGTVRSPPPALRTDASSLVFALAADAPGADQTIAVLNADPQSHDVKIAPPNVSWLTLSATQGTVPAAGSLPLKVAVNPAGLTPGSYYGAVNVQAADGTAVGTVGVTLNVSPAATPKQLVLDNLGLLLAATDGDLFAGDQTVNLVNRNSVDIDFTVQTAPDWVAVTPSAGTVPANGSLALDVTGATDSLSSGNSPYVGSARIQTASGQTLTLGVTLAMNPAPAPAPALDFLSNAPAFTAATGDPGQTTAVTIVNRNSIALNFTLATSTASGRPWLNVSPAQGRVDAGGQVDVQVTADPSGLPVGIDSGTLLLTSTADSDTFTPTVTALGVSFSVSKSQQVILLSPGALSFQAVSNGGAPPTQSLNIQNAGTGTLNWSAQATVTGPVNWLRISAASGVAPATVQVSVSAAGLSAGSYSGVISVSSPGVGNSPQTVPVGLTVSAAAADLPPVVSPASLSFNVKAGADPVSQTLTITNLNQSPLRFVAATTLPWLNASPASGTIAAGGQAQVTVQANPQGLDPAVYNGTLVIVAGNSTVAVPLNLIVSQGGCSPSALTLIGARAQPAGGSVVVGQPVAIAVDILDNCGNSALSSVSVIASFSNGDPKLALQRTFVGTFTGTWTPGNPVQGQVTITIAASEVPPGSTAPVSGQTSLNVTGGPVVLPTLGQLVNFASRMAGPISPGMLVSLDGANLADCTAAAADLPLPTERCGTQVLIGGVALPLLSVSAQQISFQVPYNLTAQTQQLVVTRRGIASAPLTVPVAVASPAFYTINQSGSGQGMIFNYNNGDYTPNGADNPAHPGDVITAFGTGLGAVDPPIYPGIPTPPPATGTFYRFINPVRVTIGGRTADVLFEGLTPGLVGVGQLNMHVPNDVTPGDRVAVIMTVAGISSPPVTMAVR
jgi:uncharacterized protein (TIGR03437 family)